MRRWCQVSLTIVLLFVSASIRAQDAKPADTSIATTASPAGAEVLTLQQAIATALANNRQIKIFDQNVMISNDEILAARTQRYPRFQGGAFDKNQALVDRLRAIAERRSVTPGQLALAWVLSKGKDIVPIPGTKRRKYLEENAAAADIHLALGEIAELEAAIPENEIAGERYAEANMRAIDRSV